MSRIASMGLPVALAFACLSASPCLNLHAAEPPLKSAGARPANATRKPPAQGTARLVMVRPCTGVEDWALTQALRTTADLYVDGMVVAAAHTCAQASATLRAGVRILDVRFNNMSFIPRLISPPAQRLEAGRTYYFRTDLRGDALVLVPITASDARDIAALFKRRK